MQSKPTPTTAEILIAAAEDRPVYQGSNPKRDCPQLFSELTELVKSGLILRTRVLYILDQYQVKAELSPEGRLCVIKKEAVL